MAIKEDNRITIRVSDKAMFCLQAAGFMDGKKRATFKETAGGRGCSPFLSNLIVDYFELGRNPDKARVELKALKLELRLLVNKRRKYEEDIDNIIQKINSVKRFIQ